METFNPYGDSVALMYSVWCQVLGCLGTYDFDKGQHVGLLVESWEVKDPKTWLFHLRKNNRFHDGSPVTAEDVVHSLKRTRDDPFTKQRQNISRGRERSGGRQIHGANHDQRADGAAARLSF